MIPTNPGFYWVKPTDRFEDNVWQPCRLDAKGNAWLLGTSFCYARQRHSQWEWGDPIQHYQVIASGPNGQTHPL